MKKALSIVLLFLFFFSCTDRINKADTSFYYWQKDFKLSDSQLDYLKNIGVKKLFVKFFDVDYDEKTGDVIPIAKINFINAVPYGIDIIPCIFITNRAISNSDENDIILLAKRINLLINELMPNDNINNYNELQIDCDWTQSTKNKYFNLLDELKKINNNINVTATIRLHQIKYYKQTGIPPVEKGALMFYNMGDIDNIDTENSIIDLSKAESFIGNLKKYPLPLDLALPAYSWAVLIRFNKVTKIINNVSYDSLINNKNLSEIKKNIFKVNKSFYLFGFYLYKDDIIRYEGVDLIKLKMAAKMLSPRINNKNINIIFFHLNEALVKEYSYEELLDVSNLFN